MKFAIASDIHGSAKWCEKFLKAADEERADEIILLGDILYHGPRNEEPEGYDPKSVAAMLNERAGSIVAARGNCDAEVDQMMLEFPCMSDYALVLADGMRLFCTAMFSEAGCTTASTICRNCRKAAHSCSDTLISK